MTFEERLTELALELPRGSSFEFEMIGKETVHLAMLRMPVTRRGAGTLFLARVFAACDESGVTAKFEADATDLPGDPTTFELVRWYGRFGCEIESAGDGSVRMRRDVMHGMSGIDGVMDTYRAARAADITFEEFELMRSAAATP